MNKIAGQSGRYWIFWGLVFLVLALLNCGDPNHGDVHDHSGGSHGDHGDHGHGDERGGGDIVTLFSPKAELFMEYPGLVMGRSTRFAAHLTLLQNYKPLTQGRVELELLSSNGQKRIIGAVNGPSGPGIFRPVLRPEKAGVYRAVLRVISPQLVDSFLIDSVRVTEKPLPPEAKEEDPEAITFLKAQAWKIPFGTAEARVRELARSLKVYGETAPASNRHAMVSAPMTGIVQPAGTGGLPQVGTQVRKGQALLQIIPPSPGTEGWVSYTESRETARLAKSEYEKAKRLYEKGAIPLSELQQAELNYQIRKSGTSEHTVKAPLSGIVERTHVVGGGQVSAGEKLMEILDPSVVWVRANLPLSTGINVKEIGSARLILPSDEGRDSAVIAPLVSAGASVDPVTKSIPLIFKVQNQQNNLRIGVPVDVELQLQDKTPVLTVPEQAIYDDDGKFVVYVQLDGETFEKRIVEKGFSTGGLVKIVSGLEPGERVVTKGGYQVRMASLSTSVPAHGHAH